MLLEILIAIVFAIVLVAVGYVFASTRKANASTATQTSRTTTLTSPLAPRAVVAKLKNATLGRFKLGDADEAKGVLVFSSGVTPFSWGFFFPVFVTAGPTGSRIDAGIRSRIFQVGPVVAKTHKEFVAELERALAGR